MVNPAFHENFGLTLIEAAACGLPIVATDDGGPRDIVRNCENGVLVDTRDQKQISEAIKSILLDKEGWKTYSRNGIDGVREHYTWQSHCATYLQELQKLKAEMPAEPDEKKQSRAIGKRLSKARKLFKHIYATDVSKEMLKQSKKSVPDANVSYHKLDGFTLSEFADDSIDLVYSHDVFVHFSFHQVYTYFQEIKRVLKNNGLCIVSFYDFKTSYPLFKEMSQKFYDQRRFPPHMRVHFVTKEAVSSILKDLQLKLVESRTKDFLVVVCRKMLNGT